MVPGVGVEPRSVLKTRKLLILCTAEYARNSKKAAVGYVAGTRYARRIEH
jgi:hypothetical protein